MKALQQMFDGANRAALLRRLSIAAGLLIVVGLGVVELSREISPFEGSFARYFLRYDPPPMASQAHFTDGSGDSISLADFRGDVVLLNFWATWCVPCIWEMPSLDRLQGALAGDGLKVVAVSRDEDGRAVVARFLAHHGLTDLDVYLDGEGVLAADFEPPMLPTSYLIDAEGRILGRVLGAVEWDSDGAKRLIRHYLERDAG